MFSPDGKQIVYVEEKLARNRRGSPEGIESSTLMLMSSTGGRAKPLVKVKGGARWPSWDPSSSRLSFTTLNAFGDPYADGGPQSGNALMEINRDGSCLSKVYGSAGTKVGASAWQPGPGRGAGPLSC